ncbi:MAG TPA: glycosyltransferase family 4 protein [Thermoplasmata archaeon]|nr:glycosyltransferase family 4 protein [Thermoplasmata archaeon]
MQPPRILFIPEVREDGTSDRSPAVLRLLRKRHEVITFPSPRDRLIYDTSRARAPRYALYAVDRLLAAVQGVRLGRKTHIELTFCETPHHALVGLWISRILGVPSVWDSHGNAAVAARSTGKGRVYTFLASALDRFLGRRVDALITVSKADAEAYEAMGVPPDRLHVIPTSVNVEEVEREAGQAVPRGTEAAKTLIFFGSYKYTPNLEALRFISARLAPYLEKEGIVCQILVAGRDLPRMDLHPSIQPVGFVEDIHALIRSADLCVVPIWSGVGILTKVVDTMATGTPLVMSRPATMGIPEIQDGVHALVATSPDRFPELVADALRNPEKMHEIAGNARRLVEARYDWRIQEPLLEDLLTKLTTGAGGSRHRGG